MAAVVVCLGVVGVKWLVVVMKGVVGAEEPFALVDSVTVDVAKGVVKETEILKDGVLFLVVGSESVCVVPAAEGLPVVVGSNLVLVVERTEVRAEEKQSSKHKKR